MTHKVLRIILLALVVMFISACTGGTEPEQKEVPKKEQVISYSVMFKPYDTFEMSPDKTIILLQASADEKNNFCLDAKTKAFDLDNVSGISFELIFDPAYIRYEGYKPGDLFEEKDKPVYEIALKGDQPNRLTGKISFESGKGKASGNKKLVTLCFKALKDGKSDLKFENREILDSEKKTIEGITWYGGALWILL